MNIGSQIRKYRKQKEFTQEQLAQKTGISLMSIRRYETEESHPRMEQLEKIAAALGVTRSELCGYHEPEDDMTAFEKYEIPDIGERIRCERIKRNMTQNELANKLGLATGTIQQYELGKRQPRMEQLEKIAEVFEITPASLCWPEKENQQVPVELEEKMVDATLTALRAFRNVIDRTIQSIENDGEMGEIMRNAIKNEMLKMMEANAEESESRKTAELGRAFGEGLAEGMKIQEKE